MPVKNTAYISFLLTSLCAVSVATADCTAAAPAQQIKPYTAKYLAYYQGDEVGHAVREFRYNEDSQCQVRMQTYASKFFYSDERYESSTFECRQQSSGDWQIKPLTYRYQAEKTFGDEAANQRFDWPQMQAQGNNEDGKWQLPVTAGTQDKISVYWRLMRDLTPKTKQYTYSVSDDGKIKHYHFVLEAEETVELPYGKLQAFKVSRTRSNGKRTTLYWFAPELANAPVRIQHFKYNELQGDLLLKEFNWLD